MNINVPDSFFMYKTSIPHNSAVAWNFHCKTPHPADVATKRHTILQYTIPVTSVLSERTNFRTEVNGYSSY